MGYALRVQGWALIQWAVDARERPTPSAAAARQRCTDHYDLLRADRNASRRGVLLEVPVRARDHPRVARRLRRRLARLVGIDLGV